MKNKAVRHPALVPVAATAAAVFFLFALAGCGSGKGGIEPPLPTTKAVTTRTTYTNPTAPTIAVTFLTGDAAINPDHVLEYHVFRNDVLLARVPLADVKAANSPDATFETSKFTYTDTGETAPIDYKTVGTAPTQLVDARSPGVGPFSETTPLIYRITAVYSAQDLEGQTVYSEQETGRSDVVEPFRDRYIPNE